VETLHFHFITTIYFVKKKSRNWTYYQKHPNLRHTPSTYVQNTQHKIYTEGEFANYLPCNSYILKNFYRNFVRYKKLTHCKSLLQMLPHFLWNIYSEFVEGVPNGSIFDKMILGNWSKSFKTLVSAGSCWYEKIMLSAHKQAEWVSVSVQRDGQHELKVLFIKVG
jgi:hypothetical protein